jgi:hypothetical protein
MRLAYQSVCFGQAAAISCQNHQMKKKPPVTRLTATETQRRVTIGLLKNTGHLQRCRNEKTPTSKAS